MPVMSARGILPPCGGWSPEGGTVIAGGQWPRGGAGVSEEGIAERASGWPIAEIDGIGGAAELGRRFGMTQVVPQDQAQDLALCWPETSPWPRPR